MPGTSWSETTRPTCYPDYHQRLISSLRWGEMTRSMPVRWATSSTAGEEMTCWVEGLVGTFSMEGQTAIPPTTMTGVMAKAMTIHFMGAVETTHLTEARAAISSSEREETTHTNFMRGMVTT